MPRTSNSVTNPALLEAALEGLKLQRERLDEQIWKWSGCCAEGVGQSRRGLSSLAPRRKARDKDVS